MPKNLRIIAIVMGSMLVCQEARTATSKPSSPSANTRWDNAGVEMFAADLAPICGDTESGENVRDRPGSIH